MNNTPESDARTYIPVFGASTVPAEFARRLERERDEARKELEEYRSIAENIGAVKAVSEKEKAICERNEALNKMADALQEVDLRTLDFERMKQERDEAREKIEQQRKEIVRLNGATSHAGGTPLKIALRERDEAQNELKIALEQIAKLKNAN